MADVPMNSILKSLVCFHVLAIWPATLSMKIGISWFYSQDDEPSLALVVVRAARRTGNEIKFSEAVMKRKVFHESIIVFDRQKASRLSRPILRSVQWLANRVLGEKKTWLAELKDLHMHQAHVFTFRLPLPFRNLGDASQSGELSP